MDNRWNFTRLYLSFSGDIADKYISELNDYYLQATDDKRFTVGNYFSRAINLLEKIKTRENKIFSYIEMIEYSDINDNSVRAERIRMDDLKIHHQEKYLNLIRNLSTYPLDPQLLKNNYAAICNYKKIVPRLFSNEIEFFCLRMQRLGSLSWIKLRSKILANLSIVFRNKKIPYSELRSYAYSEDVSIRKEAYLIEMNEYSKIQDYMAICLGNIKREETIITSLRDVENIVDSEFSIEATDDNTIRNMLMAVRRNQGFFAKYLNEKAKYLGYTDGLPYYELFAPVGKYNNKYSYEEAKDLILKIYYDFSEEMGNFAKKIFDENWIDVFPRYGKHHGSVCINIPSIGESRILINFTGTFESVLTLAREIGHAYHYDKVLFFGPLLWKFPNIFADVGSSFSEILILKYLLANTQNKAERMTLLDYYARLTIQKSIEIEAKIDFETFVLNKGDYPFTAEEFNNLMSSYQYKAYLNGFDQANVSPYSWISCDDFYDANIHLKGSSKLFGLFFSRILYSSYCKDKEYFVDNYGSTLSFTAIASLEEVTSKVSFIARKYESWSEVMKEIKKDIEELCMLFKENI
ncbi:MAG: M3 family metallopeptidase [Acholeplasmatales bacterium]|jgi:oligoendopeptidase F|nr:M3 family metallopeptidase [Acholeplasmatales bacterium]